jgi:VIT1/CCC1 family predicted Fe2+/Mn2+ transporter
VAAPVTESASEARVSATARTACPERADRWIAVLTGADLLGGVGDSHASVRVLRGACDGDRRGGEHGSPRVRGAITGAGTFIGGFLHTLPFLIPSYTTAVVVAILVVMFELATLAFLRMRFFNTSFATSLLNVALAGVIIVGISAALGSAAS